MLKPLAPLVIIFLLTSCSSPMKKLVTVTEVDLNRYSGKWYEIARLPNSFEKGLVCCMAEYSIRPDGKIKVVNSGRKEDNPSKASDITGKAWVPDLNFPGRLKVQFFWPFRADYYIFHLDQENYQYALVGTPSRKYLWILARKPILDDQLYDQLVNVAKENDFDTGSLLKVRQDCQ